MKHLKIDVFGRGDVASLESESIDTVADQPTISIYVPGVDDQNRDFLGKSLWKGYNVAIQKINTLGTPTADVSIGMEGAQQMHHAAKKNAVAEAIAENKERQLDEQTHDYALVIADKSMEKDLEEVVREGKVSGVYLIDGKHAYSPAFIDVLTEHLGNNVFNTIVEAEQGVERYRAIDIAPK